MIIPFGFLKEPVSGVNIWDSIDVVFTLREPPMTTVWTNAVMRLRRSSDNDQQYVFFDGSGKISLSSLTGASLTVPGATTLGTWVGANDAFVDIWLGIHTDNVISQQVTQGTTSSQPQLISSGVIITKNGEPAIDFLSSTTYLTGSPNTVLDSGNTFTLISVSNSVSSADAQTIFCSSRSSSNFSSRLVINNDKTTAKEIARVRNTSGTNVSTQYIAQETSTDQRVLTNLIEPTQSTGYLNNVLQDSKAWSGSYNNLDFEFGVQRTVSTPLDGTIQEFIVISGDSPDKTAFWNDIDTYYSIP